MKEYQHDLSEGSLWKKIAFFSIPLMFSNLLQVFFNMADVAVVGKFSGPIALGAVGSTTTLLLLFTGLIIGMGNGVNALIALYTGAKNQKKIEECVHTSILICFLFGVLICLLGYLFSKPILWALGTKEELMHDALLYLRIYLLGMPALGLYNFGNAVLSAIGDTKRPLIYLTIAGIVNIFFNIVFVVFFSLGVIGVAIASVIAQYLSSFFVIRTLCKSKESYGLRFRNICFCKHVALKICKIGIPSGLQYAVFAFANLFVQAGVNSFDHIMVEGNSAAANADALIYDMMAAFYTACSSFIAQNYGARKKDRILKTYFICTIYSFSIGALLSTLLYFYQIPFLYLFTNDLQVIEAGMKRITIMSMSYPFSCFMDNTIAASRGLAKTVWPTFIVIMGSCVFRVLWIFTIFAYFHTIHSLYLLYIFSWGITAIFEMIYFYSIYRKTLCQ